jgi:hypothetical protein
VLIALFGLDRHCVGRIGISSILAASWGVEVLPFTARYTVQTQDFREVQRAITSQTVGKYARRAEPSRWKTTSR